MVGTLDVETRRIKEKLDAGEALSAQEGMHLYESCDIHTLGELANTIRERLSW